MKNETSKSAKQEIGKEVMLKGEDHHLIEKYNDNYKKLSDEDKRSSFRNVITYSGSCGFASGGSNQYLVNTDQYNRYRVTVRIRWTRGIDSGEQDRIFNINAGGKTYLGCTDAGDNPITRYDRRVVGEQII